MVKFLWNFETSTGFSYKMEFSRCVHSILPNIDKDLLQLKFSDGI